LLKKKAKEAEEKEQASGWHATNQSCACLFKQISTSPVANLEPHAVVDLPVAMRESNADWIAMTSKLRAAAASDAATPHMR
jgi:hypothetical protein